MTVTVYITSKSVKFNAINQLLQMQGAVAVADKTSSGNDYNGNIDNISNQRCSTNGDMTRKISSSRGGVSIWL